jgi:hypothetical protein
MPHTPFSIGIAILFPIPTLPLPLCFTWLTRAFIPKGPIRMKMDVGSPSTVK